MRTADWWWKFWDRSWVFVNGDQQLMIPGQRHPLRLGHDSQGANVFSGKRGRASVYGHALSAAEIARLAADKETERRAAIERQSDDRARMTRPTFPTRRCDFSRGLTLEAWIQPGAATAGRIFDKMTAGGTRRFHLRHPSRRHVAADRGRLDALRSGGHAEGGRSGSHAAATADPATGALRLYLDGKIVAERPGDTVSSVITRAICFSATCRLAAAAGRCRSSSTAASSPSSRNAWAGRSTPIGASGATVTGGRTSGCPYHPMLAGGDFEMMHPLFRLYEFGSSAVRGQGEDLPRRPRLLLSRDDDHLGHLLERTITAGIARGTSRKTFCVPAGLRLESRAGTGRLDARLLGLHRGRDVSTREAPADGRIGVGVFRHAIQAGCRRENRAQSDAGGGDLLDGSGQRCTDDSRTE